MSRIRSDRGTKYAKELIDMVLSEKGVKINEEHKPINYRPSYRSTENLINGGYIKVKTTQIIVEEPQTKTSKRSKTSTSNRTTKRSVSALKKTATAESEAAVSAADGDSVSESKSE